MLDGLTRVLAREGKLSQFYHADEAKGFGEDHHIGGIVPLKLLGDVLGVAIIAPDRVWVGGEFTWGEAITVEQHGVIVRRDADEIRVEFPSGHSDQLPPDAPWQLLQDPAPAPAVEDEAPEPTVPPLPRDSDNDGPLMIDVEDPPKRESGPVEADPAEPAPAEDEDEPPST